MGFFMAEERITLAGKGKYHLGWIRCYQDSDVEAHTFLLPPATELKRETITAITTFRSRVYEHLNPATKSFLDEDHGTALQPVKYAPGTARPVVGHVRFYTKSNVGVANVPFRIELGQRDLEFIFQKSTEETARDILENIVSGRTPTA